MRWLHLVPAQARRLTARDRLCNAQGLAQFWATGVELQMTDVRRLNQRRQAKRLRYADLRVSEEKLFELVRRRIRRTMLRGKRHSLTASQHRCIAAAESLAQDRILRALLATGRREVQWSFGAELAKGATKLKFPPAPEPQAWDELEDLVNHITSESRDTPKLDDWEPPRVELLLKPADLED